jgi:hypothetical protein
MIEQKKKQIDKIAGYKTWDIKRKVDTLLQIDCELYTNLGMDSSKGERKTARSISVYIYRRISEISPIDGYLLKAWFNNNVPTVDE